MVSLPPSVHEIRQLPSFHEQLVPEHWADGNGHLNMARYLGLHDQALWPYNARFGFDKHHRDVDRRGLFTLEQHLVYHSEVLVGEEVTVHCRLLARTEKLIHGISFVLNASRDSLANTMEFVTAYVDLDRRKTTAFPDRITAHLDRELGSHARLGWTATVSRPIGVGRCVHAGQLG